jgi:serine/threonine protein kinase
MMFVDDYGQSLASEGGFEWLAGYPDTEDVTSDSNQSREDFDPERHKTYRVVLAIQMENFDGVTLDEWIAEPSIRQGLTLGNFEGALGLFKQLMGGLALLHQKGIVHRDVKPNNVMISRANGQIKIIDLGTACRVTTELSPNQGPKLPPEGTLDSLVEIGTAGYAPPEQCTRRAHRGGPASPRNSSPSSPHSKCRDAVPEADVFSAGIVLIEMLMAVVKDAPAWNTGMERATAIEALRAGHGELAALPTELRPILGTPTYGWLRQLMVRMLAWDGHIRPSSQEVLGHLHAKFFCKEKTNPFVGTLRRSSPNLCAMADPVPFDPPWQNPYVGFFLDHAPRPCEHVVAAHQ